MTEYWFPFLFLSRIRTRLTSSLSFKVKMKLIFNKKTMVCFDFFHLLSEHVTAKHLNSAYFSAVTALHAAPISDFSIYSLW